MKRRLLVVIGFAVMLGGALAMLARVVAPARAQSQATLDAGRDNKPPSPAPVTSWGVPDLQGI